MNRILQQFQHFTTTHELQHLQQFYKNMPDNRWRNLLSRFRFMLSWYTWRNNPSDHFTNNMSPRVLDLFFFQLTHTHYTHSTFPFHIRDQSEFTTRGWSFRHARPVRNLRGNVGENQTDPQLADATYTAARMWGTFYSHPKMQLCMLILLRWQDGGSVSDLTS